MKRYQVRSHGRTVNVVQPALLVEDLVLVQETAPAASTPPVVAEDQGDGQATLW